MSAEEALQELIERLTKAVQALDGLADSRHRQWEATPYSPHANHYRVEEVRLRSKAQGVAISLEYAKEALRRATKDA